MSRHTFGLKDLAWLAFLVLLVGACNRGSLPVFPPPTSTKVAGPGASPTPFQPSPTPTSAPLAARINGLEITLADYRAELGRYQSAVKRELSEADKKKVLDDLIDQALLAQAAAEKGYSVDDATLSQRLERITTSLGGAQALKDWMAANGYTDESFRNDLRRSIAAAWMRDQVISSVPQATEQVHARQILVQSSDQADEALKQLQSGQDFAMLAGDYDPVTGGDLGWFPRGYLTDPRLEEAAFSLEPDQYSGVIKTSTGYHILQVIERDPQHPLEPDARLALQDKALLAWLETRRSQSEIQVLVP